MYFISVKSIIFAVSFVAQYATSIPVDGDDTVIAPAAPVSILGREPQQSFDEVMRNAFAPAFAPGYSGDPAKDALVPRRQRGPRPKGGSNNDCTAQQSNICSSGIPYCCSTTNGKYSCVQSTVDCAQTVICCNNSFGVSSNSMTDGQLMHPNFMRSFRCA
jgi:hypothetical protein